jgi:hypothetical protein
MEFKKLKDLKKGDLVLNEPGVGLECHEVDEIDNEDGSFIAKNCLNVYPDDETEYYVVLTGLKIK